VPFGFAGQLTDAETGFQYLRARYYDPATAQFLTRDPLESLTKQPYAYAVDNPLTFVDPNGQQCNGASGDGWARLGSAFSDFGCNIWEVGTGTLTWHSNGTIDALGPELWGLTPFPLSVAGAPGNICDMQREAQDAQRMDIETTNAEIFGGVVFGGTSAVRSLPALGRGIAPLTRKLLAGGLPSPSEAAQLIINADRAGSGLKTDVTHRSATFATSDIASKGTVFRIIGDDGVPRILVQLPGELNNVSGRFEWVLDENGAVSHQRFVAGGTINGLVNTK